MPLKLTQDEIRRYAPYYTMLSFAEGFADYIAGRKLQEHPGAFGRAYDRGAECAMRRQSTKNRTSTLNSRYQVRISLYSVEDGEVGKPVSIPCLASKHRTRTAAGRALAREIRTFKAPRPGIAAHFYVLDTVTGAHLWRNECK